MLGFIAVGLVLGMYDYSGHLYRTKTEVNYIKFGNLAEIVTIPGEIYPELVIGTSEKSDEGCDYFTVPFEEPIKPMLKTRYKFIFGLTNDMVGYIIPKPLWDTKKPFAYHRKGMNSGQYNEVNSLGPETAGIVIKNIKLLIEEVNHETSIKNED